MININLNPFLEQKLYLFLFPEKKDRLRVPGKVESKLPEMPETTNKSIHSLHSGMSITRKNK